MSSSPYAPAATLLNQLWKTKKGLKTIAYSSQGELKCSKTTYAQCAHVLQQKPLLDALLKKIPSLEAKNKGLLYVLVYELILGPNKAIRGGGALKRLLMKHHQVLESNLEAFKKESPAKTKEPSMIIPRYARINTLFSSTSNVVSKLKKKTDDNQKPFIYIDPHVPDVIVMKPTASSREILQKFVASHQVILQDKSSCFSALCLVHGFDTPVKGDVLDACAAPGNKTSHLAALLSKATSKKKVKVHACDKSKDRFQLLQRRMQELTNGQVQCHNVDFLGTDDASNGAFSKVSAILLDPSCSGSGMTMNHQETTMNRDPSHTSDRIKSLSNFQFRALKHATTNFSKVNRVVYSTCSLYEQENESVVEQLLECNGDGWELVAPKCLGQWPRRGRFSEHRNLTKDQTDCLIRVNPEEDSTNGFFVACFQRKSTIYDQLSSDYYNPVLPQNMEFYQNQFNTTNKSTNDKDGSAKTFKVSGSFAGSKRKMTEETSNSSIPSKKRAKKLAWKEKQRQEKLERLQKQQSVPSAT
jgi:putative methyltransferase